MTGYKDTYIYIPKKGIIKGSIAFEKGKVIGYDEDSSFEKLDENYIVIPGFIEEHIHGCNGSDTMYATKKDLENISISLLQDGVTSFYPTTMSMSLDDVKRALNNIAQNKDLPGANILGINVEGPFICKKYCGAQDPKNIIKATEENIKELIEASSNMIKIMTIAYEEADFDIVKFLLDNGIKPSLGHSDCSYTKAQEAIDKGAHTLTHTYNAMRGIHHRDIGLLGAGLLNDSVYTELICDLHHVSAPAIELLYRLKGKDKIVLITDSMEARFLDEGQYELGGQKVYVKNGVATLNDGTLAGSILRMNDAVKNIQKTLNTSLEEAIDFATINPAKNMGIEKFKGSLDIGKDADYIVIDRNLNVIKTYIAGNLVYSKN